MIFLFLQLSEVLWNSNLVRSRPTDSSNFGTTVFFTGRGIRLFIGPWETGFSNSGIKLVLGSDRVGSTVFGFSGGKGNCSSLQSLKNINFNFLRLQKKKICLKIGVKNFNFPCDSLYGFFEINNFCPFDGSLAAALISPVAFKIISELICCQNKRKN